MGREEMFATGRLRPVAEPTPDQPIRHGFAQVSRIARADPRLSHRGFRILAGLEGYCWGDDRECWVTNKTLGKQCGGIGPNAVRLGLRELALLGYLRVDPDPSKMRGQRIRILYDLARPDSIPVVED